MTPDNVRRILIVEDDPEIQYLLSVVLEDDGREIFTAGGGAEAQAILDQESIDLVILDLILPDIDGRTLLAGLRERPETATIPVVVMSARGGAEVRQDCYTLGADHFTEKPFDPYEFAEDITVRLERSAGRDQPALVDPVTGLLNRAGLLAECDDVDASYGVALVQIDGFNSLSESWGWDAAEEILEKAGEAIRASAGPSAQAGRLGGGEFAVCMPDASQVVVSETAEAVLDALRALPIADPEGETFRLTASIGVVSAAVGVTLDDALDQARRRLFRARESGRNRVVADDEEVEERGTRILVAEDDEISATILIHRLEKEGLDVVRYNNGREAYEGALEETPALVILDIKMPGMDGFEVLERLRRTPSFSGVPIILLTSMGSESDVVRGFQLGADDYILKPFSPIELSARVWRLLRRGRSASAV